MTFERAHDTPRPGARRVGPGGGRRRGLAPGMLALQQALGNRGMAQLLARRPNKAQRESDNATTDYDDAGFAITDWFNDYSQILALRNDAEHEAIDQYKSFTELKDAPELSNAVVAAVFGVVVDLIPGGALIKAGIATGLFAHDLGSLKRDLARNDIEIPEDLGAAGPGKEHAERAEKVHGAYEKGHQLGEGYEKVKEAVDQVKEARAAAKEAEERANELAELGVKRLDRWEDAIGALEKQRDAARRWLKDAWDGERHRGGLAALVRKHLGPAPKLGEGKGNVHSELAKSWELALYRAKYGDLFYYRQTTEWEGGVVDVEESYFTAGEKYEHQGGYVRFTGLTKGLRRRIAYLVGRPAAADDDQAIAQILGMTAMGDVNKEHRAKPDYEKLRQEYGRRMPGEV